MLADKGKATERWRRKATGLKPSEVMTAGLPKKIRRFCQGFRKNFPEALCFLKLERRICTIDKGKVTERWRRKATGLKPEGAMTAGLPKYGDLFFQPPDFCARGFLFT